MKFLKANFKYLKYILIHKWYVLITCFKFGIPLRGIFHDLSKFRPSEWFPYMRYFYLGNTCVKDQCVFDTAWLKHIHRNPHHWQYWVLKEDSGVTTFVEMPIRYIKEMIADWVGAGKAIAGENNIIEWYSENKDHILLHPTSRKQVEFILMIYYGYVG